MLGGDIIQAAVLRLDKGLPTPADTEDWANVKEGADRTSEVDNRREPANEREREIQTSKDLKGKKKA